MAAQTNMDARGADIAEAIRLEQREYLKRWREANKEKVARYNKTFWQRRAERRLAGQHTN